MNRLYTLLYMTALAETAFGQKTDPQFRQLEDWLRGQGYVVAFYQSNNPDNSNNIAYYWNTEFYNRQIDEAVDSIRATFARVNKERAESYLYEYHNDGTDTINYSIAFRQFRTVLGRPRGCLFQISGEGKRPDSLGHLQTFVCGAARHS